MINVYLSDNDIEKALATLDKIDAIKGKSEIVALTRTELLLKRPDANPDSTYAALAEYFEECRSPRIASVLGDYYAGTYRDSTAMQYYGEALELDPDYTPAWYGKAGVHQMLRQYDQFFSALSHVMRDPYVQPGAKAAQVDQMMSNPQFVMTFREDFDNIMNDLQHAHPADSTINALAGGYGWRCDAENGRDAPSSGPLYARPCRPRNRPFRSLSPPPSSWEEVWTGGTMP